MRSPLRSPAQVEGTQGFLPQPEKDLERPSSTRLEATFPSHWGLLETATFVIALETKSYFEIKLASCSVIQSVLFRRTTSYGAENKFFLSLPEISRALTRLITFP